MGGKESSGTGGRERDVGVGEGWWLSLGLEERSTGGMDEVGLVKVGWGVVLVEKVDGGES